MSRKKKESRAPMPAASAGLLRFFEEETEGIKIRPELLMIFAVALIVVSVIAVAFFAP
jgi:preprotein translocase subunit Sec61beta